MSFERTRLPVRGRIAMAVAAAVLACCLPAFTQTATPPASGVDPSLRFEVVSIRPHSKDDPGVRWSYSQDGITVTGVPIRELVKNAYDIDEFWVMSVPGIPSSLSEARYDIQAKMDADTIAKLKAIKSQKEFYAQRNAMILAMLEDRFKLKAHTVTKEEPIYSLVVTKGGLKMKESAPPPVDPDTPKGQPGRRAMTSLGNGMFTAKNVGLDGVALDLQAIVRRKVVNNTGLKGIYDFTLKWRREDSPGTPEDSAAPSLFTALQEDLGLELKPTRGPVKSIVVDHVEAPSEN